jgi:hypothetical protein
MAVPLLSTWVAYNLSNAGREDNRLMVVGLLVLTAFIGKWTIFDGFAAVDRKRAADYAD